MKRKTLGAYCITYNAIEQAFPFMESINNFLSFCDEVIVNDCGSTDGTFEILSNINNSKLKIIRSVWDFNNPAEMGKQKTLARYSVSSDMCIQFDVDEFVPEWQFDSIHSLIRNFPHIVLFDLPCITFSGGMKTVAAKENFYKWRLSKNIPGIVHGVHAEARQYDSNVICSLIEKFPILANIFGMVVDA